MKAEIKEKRKERITELFMLIDRILHNVNYITDGSQMIKQAVVENVTTTQLNQINISLHRQMQEYRLEE